MIFTCEFVYKSTFLNNFFRIIVLIFSEKYEERRLPKSIKFGDLKKIWGHISEFKFGSCFTNGVILEKTYIVKFQIQYSCPN